MGLVLNPSKVESWDKSKKSKGRKKKDDAVEETGCWVKLRFGTCMPSRSKVDSSITGTSVSYAETKSSNEKSRDRELTRGGSSTTTSNAGSTTSTPYFSEELKVASQLRKFTFNELKLATRNFRPESLLGEGGFGCVFKGWVEENGTAPVKPGTGLTVAVKTLNHDGLQGHKEWLAEIYFLGDLIHPNLVKLIGYSIEDDQRLLVYEFLPRGSLENHLFRRSLPLPWSIRMRIALGAAKGLAFLHEEVQKPVIYRDFKTSNILLDADYNAKLSDFGLAKDGPEGDKTHVSTRVMGTYGYAAPEYVMTGHLTSKSDVYSFGVVLLEMLNGRRSMDKNRPNGEHNLVQWARQLFGDAQPFNSPSLSSFNKSLLYICSLTCFMAPLVKNHVEPPHAKILAIGTANPPNVYYQKDYPDFLFRVIKNEHRTDLREKFDRICEKSRTRKRYLYLTEEILKANPSIYTYGAPSLDVRQDMLNPEVPKLGQQAALEAIKEWGQPISKITHLIFCTASCVDMPGADFQLVKLLGLNPSVTRTMIYEAGCYAGATVLRLAKDFAENNKGARVLVVCAEITTVFFHGLTDTHLDILVGQALFADGASAVIVGANPEPEIESPLFEIVACRQTIIPNSEHGVVANIREMGFNYYLSGDVPKFVGGSVVDFLTKTFEKVDGKNKDWNSLFFSVHPGGPAIVDQVEEQLGLKAGKLRATRHVLSEYGNMGAPSVHFILDEMRNKSIGEGKATTGEGLEWGVVIGIGPGLTVETAVLRSESITC